MPNQSLLNEELKKDLDNIASKYPDSHCYLVADEMQTAFKKHGHESKVWEIYTDVNDPKNGTYIMINECRVINHYVNDLLGIIFDSSTGSKGKIFDAYIAQIQRGNPPLKYRIVD